MEHYYLDEIRVSRPGANDPRLKAILDFMKNPSPEDKSAKDEKEEKPWSEDVSEVVHLKDDTFDEFMGASKSVLVIFYAPW